MPPKYAKTLCCVFLPAVKKNFTDFKRLCILLMLLGFGPTEVSLTKIACTQQDSPPQMGRL